MIQTEQLAPDTILLHVRGHFHEGAAKELALSVFHSHRLGFKTFLLDLSLVSLIDNESIRRLALIEQGLQNKGGTWRVLNNPFVEPRRISSETLEEFPKETWN